MSDAAKLGGPVVQEAASNKEEVAFQVDFDLHSKEVAVPRSLGQSWQLGDGSKNLVKGMVLVGQMLLLKDMCERVCCHSRMKGLQFAVVHRPSFHDIVYSWSSHSRYIAASDS